MLILPYLTSVWEVSSFLGHAGFYRHFVRYFSTIAIPLTNVLQKDMEFIFDDKCKEAFDHLKQAFDHLKQALTSTPMIQLLDWFLPFKWMCDASNYALGAVLAQRVGKVSYVIYYA